MIPAGIRLDLYNSAVKLPDEMVIPLIRSSNAPTKTEFGPNVPLLANEGYVRVNSAKYRDWQVLAFESAMDTDLLQKEQRLYEDWLSHQPPAVERRKYPAPTAVGKRPPPVENGPELTCAERWRRIEADTEADEDERRRGNADAMSTSGVTRGDPAINSAFKLEDVRADRTPVLHDGQDVSYQLFKVEDDGAISDVSTNSAVEGASAVRAKEDVSATEDSAIAERDHEERSELALRDAQPVMDNRAKFGVIRLSIVGEANSAVRAPTTINAGINHVVTANSALGEPAARNDLGAVPVCHGTTDYERDECGRVDVYPAVVADSAVTTANSERDVLLSISVEANSEGLSWTVNTSSNSDEGEARAESGVDGLSSAAVVNSAMGTQKACNIQSAAVDSASEDLSTESVSDVATACRQDVSYTEDAFARTEVSSAVTTNSADEHSDATKDYDSREVLLPEGIKPNDDPATANSALETMEAETGSEVVRQHDDDTIYLGDKFEHAGVRSAIAVNSANTGPDADDTYDLSEDKMKMMNAARQRPNGTLRQHYLAIAATEDEQEDDVDDGKTDIFERVGSSGLTDYAHELAFLPDLTEVEPTELDYGAPNLLVALLADAASGFWAVLMTRRARQISAFVCALGHFEWLRMPFGLKNAPMIYQRLIDNALWGYVQPKGGWQLFAERMAIAEAESGTRRVELGGVSDSTQSQLTKFEADHQ
ncbi:hypothetical protein PInf_002553 [Phytophthora infestans]|nr:hypothetical protein PInf_002553 [Phytophthora infestans]